MNLSEVHEYHLVIARNMKKSLENLDIFKGIMSLSEIIVKILLLLAPVIKREHRWGEQRMSRYMYVSPDPGEKRDHVHVYLPVNLYRELKLIHQDLNFFSIAQILRGFLEVFLDLVEEYGDNIFKELESMYKQWEEMADATRLTLRQYIRQLWIVVQHLPEKKRLINVYDEHFSPFWILRL
jgi:hypothetical protein